MPPGMRSTARLAGWWRIPPAVDRGPHDGGVAQSLGEAAGSRVGADQRKLDVGMAGCPLALELPGMAAHGRPGMPDAEHAMTGRGLGDEVVCGRQNLANLGQHARAGDAQGHAPAGPVQETNAE